MAFATMLVRQEKDSDACPHLKPEARDALDALLEDNEPFEGFRDVIEALREDVRKVDLKAASKGLGARYDDGSLYIKCLGRDFIVSEDGYLESMCHVNVWCELMLFNYCKLEGKGTITNKWVSYWDLPSAAPTAPYFEKNSEAPLKAMADEHTDVFMDMLGLFGAEEQEGFESDYAVVIYPLPKVPFLLLYTRAEEGFESRMKILLDSGVINYIPKESLTYISRGIVEMFKKILSKHEMVSQTILSK
jgi:hypothetical protein